MINPIPEAFRILGRFWLEEVQPDHLTLISALPELGSTLPQTDGPALTELAIEYQRLFGFNLPPYESVFVDPSAMLMAPATHRVQALYRRAHWTPPTRARAGARDHLGLELLALADWLERGQTQLARQLHTRHLALWMPAFNLALGRLAPHPFYATLNYLTLDLLLTTLPANPLPANSDPFPVLPPPPTYEEREMAPSPAVEEQELSVGLRDILRRLLSPRDAGMFLTRQDVARISQTLDLPGVMGERYRMLETLFRLSGQYEMVPALFDQLMEILAEAQTTYQAWADEYPAWAPYARAWCQRATSTQVALHSLIQEAGL